MKKIEKVSIIGLGAIGCAYASKIHDMDPECIRAIVNRERVERYSREGFYINDKLYNFNYVLPEEDVEPADLVIVAVKYHGLQQAIKDIKKHVGPDTTIMSLLNGISSEEIIGKEYGMDKMLYSTCVRIDALHVGNRISFTDSGEILFGEKENKVHTPRVKAIKDLFDRAGISYTVPEDMIKALWWKFMVNVGINQASAVLRAPYRVFMEVKEAHEFMRSAMKEVVDLSQRVGINLQAEDMEKFDNVLRALSPDGKTSMLQDIEAGRKTEVEMFAETVCKMGKEYGLATPVNEALFRMIRTIEQM